MQSRISSWACIALFFCACSGVASIDEPDAGTHDAGITEDAGPTSIDAGITAEDAGTTIDAGIPDAGPTCSSPDAGWSCSADGTQRDRCFNGHPEQELCSRGCLRPPPGTEASCLVMTDTLSCTGSYGTVKSTRGDYFLTAFGCWVDANGTVHTDSGDNCIPTCLDRARTSGLCMPGDTGPQCEQRVTWFTADAARFGCLARLRITNPANGKTVVAVALDYGPSCALERAQNFPILDASGRVDRSLFGADQGASDRSLVHVVEVDPNTPLGPVP